MDEQLLKAYFAPREDVPQALRAGLHQRLLLETQEACATQTVSDAPIGLVLTIAPISMVFSVMLLLLVWAVFGHGAFLLGGAFYMFSLMGGAAVIFLVIQTGGGYIYDNIYDD